jgi:hypothetical protein
MIIRFLHIVAAGGPVGYAELAEIAALAAAMGASWECRQVFGCTPEPGMPIGGAGVQTRRPALMSAGLRE